VPLQAEEGKVPRPRGECRGSGDAVRQGRSGHGLAHAQLKVELYAFLGLANYYRRFILNFSSVVAPLSDATKGDKKACDWGGEQAQAFATIKKAFSTAPVLRLPDPSKPFTVTTDASDFGIGGVLEQDFEDGAHPIAYVSRKLNALSATIGLTIESFWRSFMLSRSCIVIYIGPASL
jgi:RNase H-like domain found in reverse transcriptase